MDSVSLIRRLNEHRLWTNRQILAAASRLNVSQLQQPFAIGQGTVFRTVTHLYGAEYVWFETLQGNDDALTPGDVRGQLTGNQAAEDGMRTIDEVQAKWEALDIRWNEYIQTVTEAALAEMVYRISVSSGYGRRSGCSRADVLLHVALHSQYTIAQLNNMLKQLGMSPLIDPMLMSMAREEFAARSET